jgi:hypothetical protein
MNEEKRRRFESLYNLSEQAWRDWDHKTRHEWKLSFGIWAALLAAAAGFDKIRVNIPLSIVVTIGLIIFGIHLIFLSWIQIRLKDYRAEMNVLAEQMRRLAGTSQIVPKHSRLGVFSPIIQLAITILAVFVFGFVCLGGSHLGTRDDMKLSNAGVVRSDSLQTIRQCQCYCIPVQGSDSSKNTR